MKKLLPVLLISLALFGAACSKKGTQTNSSTGNQQTSTTNQTVQNANTGTTTVTWMQRDNGWVPSGTPPSCPTPLLVPPVDITTVTSILYPGQTRGGNYKPHGGFRFDRATTSSVSVTAPGDAMVVRGARYLVNGETQYTFDFIMPCGRMYRMGHFLKLTPKFQGIADTFPPAAEGDSRTNNVNPQVSVEAGEEIAREVGTTVGGLNVFFDFGVYDLTTKNAASANPSFVAAHANDVELAQHALCWFDLLPAADETTVRSLPPGDPTSGKTSDYCT